MRLATVNAGKMREALERLVQVVPSRTTMPVLECVYMRPGVAVDTPVLCMSATDMDTWADAEVDNAEMIPAAAGKGVTVNARKLLEFFRAFHASTEVTLHTEEFTLELRHGRNITKLHTLPFQAFPNRMPEPEGEHLVVGCQEFAAAAGIVAPFISTDDTRAVIMGTLFEWKPASSTCTLTATNGRNLVQVRLPTASIRGSGFKAWKANIPRTALAGGAALAIEFQGGLGIRADSHRVAFNRGPAGRTELLARLIDGQYPDVENGVIATVDNSRTVVMATAEDMLAGLQRQCLLASPSRTQATLRVKKRALTLSSSGETGSQWAEEEMDWLSNGPDAEVSIPLDRTLGLLRQVAAANPEQEVFLRWGDAASPVHLMTESKGDLIIHAVVAPINAANVRKRAA